MNKLSREQRAKVVACLVEGTSIRATVRLTGVAKNTIVKLLSELGAACALHMDKAMRGLSCRRIQCDEIWSFCYAKQKNVPEEMRGTCGVGDVWTWVAIDADTKLIPCWRVGDRSATSAFGFMHDLAARLKHRVQLTTDGHRAYLEAVEDAFGCEIDYAMLLKIYGRETVAMENRYSPPTVIATKAVPVYGNPNRAHISTSYSERQNLTMRMHMRRFTRLTNAFSKKLENHKHAQAIYFMYYNFCRIHQTLRVTPAMEAGITDHVWELDELLNLMN